MPQVLRLAVAVLLFVTVSRGAVVRLMMWSGFRPASGPIGPKPTPIVITVTPPPTP